MKSKKILIYLALIFILFFIVAGFYNGTFQGLSDTNSKLIAIGRWLGIFASFSVLIEVILMSRLPLLENNFDLEDIGWLHRWNGYIVLYGLLAHLVFLTIGYGGQTDASFISQFIILNTDFKDVLWATFGSILFIAGVVSSIKILKRKIKYETWYLIHLLIYVAIAMTFLHQINSGSDFVTQDWYKYYWILLYAATFFTLFYYRFARQFIYQIKHGFKVARVVAEANNIFSIYITGKNINKFKYQAGQYAGWRFLAKGYWLESHPFSFSNPPGLPYIRFTIKSTSGDHSNKLKNLAVGAPVLLDGPRGSFDFKRLQTDEVVFIAGGIGSAPFVSMLPLAARNFSRVTFIYCLRNKSELAFEEEINQIIKQFPNVNFAVHETSVCGRLNDDLLTNYVKPNKNLSVMICGPDAMSVNVKEYLVGLGIPSERIITERFVF